MNNETTTGSPAVPPRFTPEDFKDLSEAKAELKGMMESVSDLIPGSAIASPERSAQMREPDDYRKTYREMFLDAVWNAFDERHPCFHGDCDHHIQKDCDLAIRDFARNMVERYYE